MVLASCLRVSISTLTIVACLSLIPHSASCDGQVILRTPPHMPLSLCFLLHLANIPFPFDFPLDLLSAVQDAPFSNFTVSFLRGCSIASLDFSLILILAFALGAISNVADYSKWIYALMYESGPVFKEGHTMMKYPLSSLGAEISPYARLGWYRSGIEGGMYMNEKGFSHIGGISAYASTFKFLPDRKFGVIVFQNAQNNALEAIAWRLIDEFLGIPEDEFYDMNKTQFDFTRKREEQLGLLPSELYPSVPSISVKPQLPLQSYTGFYVHAVYRNSTITLDAPADLLDGSEFQESDSVGLPLYATSRGGAVLFTFRHMSSEHWLLEMRMVMYGSKGVDDYEKAKFEIAANGVAERLGVVTEAAVLGDKAWAWFDRIE